MFLALFYILRFGILYCVIHAPDTFYIILYYIILYYITQHVQPGLHRGRDCHGRRPAGRPAAGPARPPAAPRPQRLHI